METKFKKIPLHIILGSISLLPMIDPSQASDKYAVMDFKGEEETTTTARNAKITSSNNTKLEEEKRDSHDRLVSFLKERGAEFRVVEHDPEGECKAVSALRGSTLDQSAKAILVSAEITKKLKKYYLLALKATQQVDFEKIKKVANAKSVHMAPAPKAQSLTDCVMGAIPPLSFHPDLHLIVDPELIKDPEMEMAFNAGRLDRSIFLKVSDYLRIVQPQTIAISK